MDIIKKIISYVNTINEKNNFKNEYKIYTNIGINKIDALISNLKLIFNFDIIQIKFDDIADLSFIQLKTDISLKDLQIMLQYNKNVVKIIKM